MVTSNAAALWLILALGIGVVALAVWITRGPHTHVGASWDGMFEHCRCGASSGDLRDANGMRHVFFRDWPDEAREVAR